MSISNTIPNHKTVTLTEASFNSSLLPEVDDTDLAMLNGKLVRADNHGATYFIWNQKKCGLTNYNTYATVFNVETTRVLEFPTKYIEKITSAPHISDDARIFQGSENKQPYLVTNENRFEIESEAVIKYCQFNENPAKVTPDFEILLNYCPEGNKITYQLS